MIADRLLPIVLLTVSNTFMTFAWYGHLKYTSKPLWLVILASWSIAFLEYCFQVPANRLGYKMFSAAQLKVLTEVIAITIFLIFDVLYLREQLQWNYVVSFVLIIGAVVFAFAFR